LLFGEFEKAILINFLLPDKSWISHRCTYSGSAVVSNRVARWFVFKPKIPNLGKFREMVNVGIFYDHLECFMAVWYSLWSFGRFPNLVCFDQKNLATLVPNGICTSSLCDFFSREKKSVSFFHSSSASVPSVTRWGMKKIAQNVAQSIFCQKLK
jgi:hypothetical protein